MQVFILHKVMVLCVAFGLIGCALVAASVEQSRERDPGNINLSKTLAYDPGQVAKYKKIFVLSRAVQADQQVGMTAGRMIGSGMATTGGASEELLSGRIALELTKAGYDVLERDDIERIASEEQIKAGTERIVMALAKETGADAVITTVIQQGTVQKVGLFGVGGGFESGIIGTSIKIIDVATNRSIAIISSDYPEPRTATETIGGLLPFIFNALLKPVLE